MSSVPHARREHPRRFLELGAADSENAVAKGQEMNFRDQRLTCTQCGKTFIYTVTEQRKLYESRKNADESSLETGSESAVSTLVAPPEKCPSCLLYDPETERWSGKVKWFSYAKGYGFIAKPNGEEIFFHRSQVVDEALVSLEEGTPVSFMQVSTDRGLEAQQVEVESG
jgi:CspA family cold shock protein